MASLELNGVQVSQDGWSVFAGSNPQMVGKALTVTLGIHHLKQTQLTRFGAYVFGSSDQGCAYSYAAGMCLLDTSVIL